MELIKALAICLHEDEVLKGAWPEGPESATQVHTSVIEFDAVFQQGYKGKTYTTDVFEDVNGMPYIGEWDRGDTVTKEEYLKFLEDNPNWYENMLAERPTLVAKIAELNKQVGALVNQMSELADQAGVDININLGQHGYLDPNSDWDSSRC